VTDTPPAPQQTPSRARLSRMNIAFLVEQVQAQIRVQEDQWGSIRTRATVVLGSAGLILARSVEVRTAVQASSPSKGMFALYALLGGSLLTASVAALISFLQYRIRNDPDPGALVRGYLQHSSTRTKLHLLPNLIESYEYNRGVLRGAALPLQVAVGSLILALMLFFVIALNLWGAQWLRNPSPTTPAATLREQSSVRAQPVDSSRSQIAPSSATARESVQARPTRCASQAPSGREKKSSSQR